MKKAKVSKGRYEGGWVVVTIYEKARLVDKIYVLREIWRVQTGLTLMPTRPASYDFYDVIFIFIIRNMF